MDNTLVNNWNSMISNNDKVYFLGDLAFGRNSSTDYWIRKLNGNIIFFKGNHDYSVNIDFIDSTRLTFGNIPFFLTHDPADVPADWLTNYKPVNMNTILRLLGAVR